MSKLHLIVCERLAREFSAALALEKLHDVLLETFPARCVPAWLDREALERFLAAHDQRDCRYIVGPCSTTVLGELPADAPRQLKWVETCTDLFLNPQLADFYLREGDCLVLPGELENWDAAAAQGREERLRAAKRLVLLDTGLTPDAPATLAAVAASVGLPAAVLPVGLDFVRLTLARMVLEWRLEEEKSRSTAALSEAIRRSSDHAMALDLIGTLTRVVTEAEAVENMLDLFTLLFAPGKLLYLSWHHGEPAEALARPAEAADLEEIAARLSKLQNDHDWTAAGTGFMLRLKHQDETLGLLEVDSVAFPQHLEHYLDLALILGRVCALTIANARAYEKSRHDEEIIRHHAYHDTLTGLPNRRFFHERLTAALGLAQRGGHLLAVMFVDLDGFKWINDQFGHDVGDLLLQEVALRLQKAVRTDDMVARMGGDEFLLLLPTIERAQNALQVAQRIRQNLSRAFDYTGQPIRITASVGIALYPQDGEDAETLIKHADAALYRVKERGKDGSALFSGERS